MTFASVIAGFSTTLNLILVSEFGSLGNSEDCGLVLVFFCGVDNP